MISVDFAPNESWDDAWISLKLLLQPWRWKSGKELNLAKKKVLKKMLHVTGYMLHVSFFLSGRAGLFTILQALHLPKDMEVLVQAFTCEAVILPMLANGLKPVYVDIEEKTFSIDPIDLQKKITDKAKVLILQHSFSMTPAHRDHVLSLVKKHKLLLIEDIAHGYSVQKNPKSKIQNLKSTFLMSFGRSKALSSVFGGAVVTSNKELQQKLEQYEASLQMPSMSFIFRLLLYKPFSVLIKATYDIFIGKLIHKLINLVRLIPLEITNKEKSGKYDQLLDKAYPNALSILLLRQLHKYEQIQKNRALICDIYSKKISNFKFRISNKIPNSSLLRYPVLVENPNLILQKASKQNIFLGNWYNQVVAPKSISLAKMKYKRGTCPNAEALCGKIINLPTNISYQEALKVIELVNEYSRNNK